MSLMDEKEKALVTQGELVLEIMLKQLDILEAMLTPQPAYHIQVPEDSGVKL